MFEDLIAYETAQTCFVPMSAFYNASCVPLTVCNCYSAT